MLGDRAASAQHTIFAHESEEGRIYFPAWLLIDRLWVWSARALRALFIPNSLDVLIRSFSDEVLVSADLIPGPVTKIAETRIRWLVASQDARASWASVFTNAQEGRINLMLPEASMRGWAWGARVRGGLLACDLASIDINFDVEDSRPVRVGKK